LVEELLALVVEEVSVLASDRRRKEPLKIPRPYKNLPPNRRDNGFRRMLAAAQRKGVVRRV
jgi:hypothetical protein